MKGFQNNEKACHSLSVYFMPDMVFSVGYITSFDLPKNTVQGMFFIPVL